MAYQNKGARLTDRILVGLWEGMAHGVADMEGEERIFGSTVGRIRDGMVWVEAEIARRAKRKGMAFNLFISRHTSKG